LSWLAVRHMAARPALDEPDEILFAEVVRPQEWR
jgi:hypothetical protein